MGWRLETGWGSAMARSEHRQGWPRPGAQTLDARGREGRRAMTSCSRWQLGRAPWKSPSGGFCFLSERGRGCLLLGRPLAVGEQEGRSSHLSAQETSLQQVEG